MTITTLVYALAYAALVFFLVACVTRGLMYARMPVHLRWELYPVPHEDPRRVKHGGSYFEDVDWWTRPAHFNIWGELRFMIPEILFLKGLWEFNRKLWWRSFPFHFGLYLLITTILLLLMGATLEILVPAVITSPLGTGLRLLYASTGLLGAVLTTLGALGLLERRLRDEDLKAYTVPGDIFNLLLFILTFALLAAGYVAAGPAYPGTRALVKGLLTFDATIRIPGLLAAGLSLACLLVAYIPLTHMSHFIGKYFTYHSVRWDDQALAKAGRIQTRLAEYLTYRPTWAAPHIGAGGSKTWADIAATNPWQEGKK